MSKASVVRYRQWLLAGLAALAVTPLAACAARPLPAVTSGASHQLNADVDRLTAAVRTRDAIGVQTALDTLRRDVVALKASGGITATRASEVLSAAARVAADAGVTGTSASPKPTSQPKDKAKDGGSGDSSGGGD